MTNPVPHLAASRPALSLPRLLLAALLAVVLPAGGAGAQAAPGAGAFRVAVAQFSVETCTFCPRPTGIEQWEAAGPPERGEAVLRRGSYVRGFVTRAAEYPEVRLVGVFSPREPSPGVPSGWVTAEAFERYTRAMQEDLRAQGPFDAVYLALHGAMAVEGVPRPEAEIVRRVRQVVGAVPVAVTVDLHANVDRELSDAASGVFMVKHFPHYDAHEQGERAARFLARTLRGDYRPVMAVRKPGVVTPSVAQWSGEAPTLQIMERARIWEASHPDLFVSVALGFAYADVPDLGAAVMVVANGDRALAERAAQDMSDFLCRVRERFVGREVPDAAEGVRQALRLAAADGRPVVIADHMDHLGDATWVLRELIRQEAAGFVVAALYDHRAVERLREEHRVGDRVRLEVGGFTDALAGGPVPLEGVVEYLGRWGRHETVATLRFGRNNRVILTPAHHQVTSPTILADLGIPLGELGVVVVKSRVNFRPEFADAGLGERIVFVDTPGWTPADLTRLTYRNAPAGLYPLGPAEACARPQ